LQDLEELNFNLELTGFEPQELDKLMFQLGDQEQADEALPLPEIPSRAQGTCGCAAKAIWHIGFCAAMPPMRQGWPACWASVNR
jgi:hypothetical protein